MIGLVWMSLFFIPLYYLFYGIHEFRETEALDMAVSVVVYSLFLELLATIATITWKVPR